MRSESTLSGRRQERVDHATKARASLAGSSRLRLSPERLYLIAVGLSGCAAVGSVALPTAQRGGLAACVVSATLGAAIGGLSIDTFLLSRPVGWVFDRGAAWIGFLLVGCLALSAAVAALLTTVAGLGSYRIAMAGAAVLTIFNACSSLALRLKRFVFVYSMRAAGGVVLIGGYAVLYADHRLSGTEWSYAWLVAQVVAAIGVAVEVVRRARRSTAVAQPRPPTDPARRGFAADLTALAKLHLGICAQMLTFRLDQVLLARFAGAGPLGVYALAVSALEFAQSGAVVTAQKILADRGPATGRHGAAPVLRAAVPVAVASVAALAVLGRLVPAYHSAWLPGLLLLPGCLAVSVGKAWSANLLKQRGEQATATVALLTLAVVVPCYLVLIPWIGSTGAALASSFAYAIHAFGSRLSLRRPRPAALPDPVA
jgi:hypothetical protein